MKKIFLTGKFIYRRAMSLSEENSKWVLITLLFLCLVLFFSIQSNVNKNSIKAPVKKFQPLMSVEEKIDFIAAELEELKKEALRQAVSKAESKIPRKKPNCDGLEHASMLWKWTTCK